MKQLRSVEMVPENVNVILRMDTDLPFEGETILDDSRLKKTIPTIRYLLEKNCKIIILGHRGRPEGKVASELSLKPVYVALMELLQDGQQLIDSVFVDDIKDENKIGLAVKNNQIIFGENLRFWSEEDAGDTSLFGVIKRYTQALVNDAFAVAHRKNASIILHREMETYYGFSFAEEVEKISQILEKEERPMIIILGGAKEDKLKYIDDLLKIADHILIGGKLPKLVQNPSPASRDLPLTMEAKIVVAKLREDGLDLSEEDIVKFSEIISSSKTIIWSGAMGFYEQENSRIGTQKIAQAVADSLGQKIIAGGDTSASIKDLGLKNKIDFICSGGGVMLEMLVKGDLPAWS
ncbi:MAG: phosphoglycerate kinase [Candidatus Shapirobacteria bacterium]|nr:phosphoglycerate kinase [Candidatus Shapirobacteria bacterium]